jgi:Leucine-rich repeat (LRR) protein
LRFIQRLKEIPKGIENLSSLGNLNLFYNEIQDFDVDFEQMKGLKFLDISYNFIKTINDSFTKLEQLEGF